MKLLRWDTNTLPEIGDIVLSNSIENMDLVLAEMTRLYLEFGGDASISWETDNKIEIIKDLETKITAILPEMKNISHNVYAHFVHCYKSKHDDQYYNNLEDYIENYGLVGVVEIEQAYTCCIDFLENIKEKSKRLYRLIQRVMVEFTHNPVIAPTTAVNYFDYIRDYYEEMAEEEPAMKDQLKNMERERDLFDKLLPQPKIKPSVIRLQRLKKIYNSLREQLHPALAAWLDCTFEYLWLTRDEKIQDEFNDAIDLIYSDEHAECDDIADISSMVLMTVNFGSELQYAFSDDWEDHLNSGITFPSLKMNIENKEQMESFSRFVNFLSLYYSVIEHLPEGDVYEKH